MRIIARIDYMLLIEFEANEDYKLNLNQIAAWMLEFEKKKTYNPYWELIF